MSKEGVAQGDPLAMILYALAVLLLILHLKELISTLGDITNQLQKWFAAVSRPHRPALTSRPHLLTYT
eukprot:2633785-Ditylum_brightwellii.AAC.1